MSCRSSAASSAVTSFARAQSGLSDAQTQAVYHRLRAAGRGTPMPTAEEWQRFLAFTRFHVQTDRSLSAVREAALLRRLDHAADAVPDGASWYALQRVRAAAVDQAAAVESRLRQAAAAMGVEVGEVRARYRRYLAEAEAVRGTEGARVRGGDGLDAAASSALDRVKAEACGAWLRDAWRAACGAPDTACA